jgi:hypothetical protein
VALAVCSENGVKTREVETGSQDREGNMVRFAVEGLRLVRDVIQGQEGAGDGGKVEGQIEGVKEDEEENVKLVPGDKGEGGEVAVGALAS